MEDLCPFLLLCKTPFQEKKTVSSDFIFKMNSFLGSFISPHHMPTFFPFWEVLHNTLKSSTTLSFQHHRLRLCIQDIKTFIILKEHLIGKCFMCPKAPSPKDIYATLRKNLNSSNYLVLNQKKNKCLKYYYSFKLSDNPTFISFSAIL